jgi:hypothetical protein
MSWFRAFLNAIGRIIAMLSRRLRDIAVWSVQNSRNFGISLLVIVVAALAVNPSLGPAIGRRIGDGLTGLFGAILHALAPLVEPTLTLVIIGLGAWFIFKSLRGS